MALLDDTLGSSARSIAQGGRCRRHENSPPTVDRLVIVSVLPAGVSIDHLRCLRWRKWSCRGIRISTAIIHGALKAPTTTRSHALELDSTRSCPFLPDLIACGRLGKAEVDSWMGEQRRSLGLGGCSKTCQAAALYLQPWCPSQRCDRSQPWCRAPNTL